MKYSEQLLTDEWKIKAEQIKDRDHYTCKICGKQYNLQVHHREYIKGLMAWEYPDRLLITLCGDCHSVKHNKAGGMWKSVGQLIKEVYHR